MGGRWVYWVLETVPAYLEPVQAAMEPQQGTEKKQPVKERGPPFLRGVIAHKKHFTDQYEN
ncbi:hypothetical protein CLU88_2412 [Acidovorax sp. 56]|nr:hypothetical protein CLU88_2412 [Acidovorax sp. 56]